MVEKTISTRLRRVYVFVYDVYTCDMCVYMCLWKSDRGNMLKTGIVGLKINLKS
jgi:hypothetical protein